MLQTALDSEISILMYHSVSDGPGPTCIPLQTFQAHLDSLVKHGYKPVSLTDFAAWHSGRQELPSRPVVITFDDGFLDFAETAYPELQSRGFTATVFLPVSVIGKCENWEGQLNPPRRLMDWAQIGELAKRGIEFGGHSLTHPDMTRLTPDELERETRLPQKLIQSRIGGPLTSCFAPPYGKSNAAVRTEIRNWYQLSVGVRLDRAQRSSDLYDLPRIEMHYFRNIRRWNSFLEGRAETYFTARRLLRNARRFV